MNEDMDKFVHQFERKLDRFNHVMELLRTLFGFCTLLLQIVILCKLFGII